ncbi:TAM domain methyltransferase [Colletotrichum orchidophilum]|uniref:TAM domain methyltransferase n=1 Tax=Colletotrichum orchidophilum TaxID=1209926 RepID=A0A1G4B6G7_9PEZI|nr:TAM domain methyltransferase [Colletotrichum orchidophilum]OHE96997.1 TAM domain methyltransferase [Colletotrichum orchidophilum]
MQHEIFLYNIGHRLGQASSCDKVEKVGRVFDVGTGTDIWAIDFGELHPEAEVNGLDLSSSQPDLQGVSSLKNSDDNTFQKNSALAQYVNLLQEDAEKAGCDYFNIPGLADLMTKIGFTDISVQIFKWPINGWPKEDR